MIVLVVLVDAAAGSWWKTVMMLVHRRQVGKMTKWVGETSNSFGGIAPVRQHQDAEDLEDVAEARSVAGVRGCVESWQADQALPLCCQVPPQRPCRN